MDDEHLTAANRMAGALVRQEVDPNEVASCLATLRRQEMTGPQFFKFLETVALEGQAVVRSKQTLGYYRTIQDACRTYLEPYKDDAEKMAKILGWTVRLMRFYRVADRLEAPPSGDRPMRPSVPTGKQRPVAGAKTGSVKFFNEVKGFGYISGDDGSEIFVHQSALAGGGALRKGQRVSYEVGQGRKGPAAKNVQKLD